MELVGKLRERVSTARSAQEAHDMIEEAGMCLTDSELDSLSGAGLDMGVGSWHFVRKPSPGGDDNFMAVNQPLENE
ncbi:MAG: hypothetical protein IJT34_02295 [Butyrivibrio sp.]|nr:hypothetical protein [Butyrivibrio sp.]